MDAEKKRVHFSLQVSAVSDYWRRRNTIGAHGIGIASVAFGAAIIGYLLFRFTSPDKKYALTDGGVFLQCFRTKLAIEYKDIEYISYLNEVSFTKFLNSYLKLVVESERTF